MPLETQKCQNWSKKASKQLYVYNRSALNTAIALPHQSSSLSVKKIKEIRFVI